MLGADEDNPELNIQVIDDALVMESFLNTCGQEVQNSCDCTSEKYNQDDHLPSAAGKAFVAGGLLRKFNEHKYFQKTSLKILYLSSIFERMG